MQHLQPLSRVKKTPDFIGRNRRAVRNAGRERGKETVPLKAPGQRRREKANDTVEISKSYLDKLLQMCLAPQQSMALDTTSATTLPTAPGPTGHIKPDHKHGPRACPAPNADGLSHRHSEQAAAALSPQEQWLSDLAQQRTEQIAKREEEKLRKRTEDPPEEYFPWGRPGGGAPIRTVSGTLLTNYSTRGQAVESMRNTQQYNSLERRAPRSPEHAPPPHKSSEHAPPPQRISPPKSQFARGLGPHVDTFVLSQREVQRRKELIHKEQLEAQIAERRRQREAERLKHELEEREAELRVRREIEEMNKRNERERERQRHKAEQERMWQAMLQAQIEEAEEAAQREKLAQREQERAQIPAKRELPSRIPLPIKPAPRPPHITHVSRADGHRAAAMRKPLPQHLAHQSRLQAPSPPLPAVARAMAGQLSPGLQHSHISHNPPSQPATSPLPQQPPMSPIVPALAKKLASQTISQPPPNTLSSSHHTSPPLPAVACRPQPQPTRHSPSLPTHHPSSDQHSSPPRLPLPNLTPSQEHTGIKFPTQPPDMGARQQTILHQLAILREGILSQRNAVDIRLQQNLKLTPTNSLP